MQDSAEDDLTRLLACDVLGARHWWHACAVAGMEVAMGASHPFVEKMSVRDVRQCIQRSRQLGLPLPLPERWFTENGFLLPEVQDAAQ